MKKIKDLEVDDFPGVNPEKFQEWKNLQEENMKRLKIVIPIGIVLWFLLVFLLTRNDVLSLPVVLVDIGIILFVVYVLIPPIKVFKLNKELGITVKNIREARKK